MSLSFAITTEYGASESSLITTVAISAAIHDTRDAHAARAVLSGDL